MSDQKNRPFFFGAGFFSSFDPPRISSNVAPVFAPVVLELCEIGIVELRAGCPFIAARLPAERLL
jgi:hypothetical protein